VNALASREDNAEKEGISYWEKGRKESMPPLQDFRAKLLAQRRELFRQAAQTEEDLLWLETDVEREIEERGQTETMLRLLDRLDERAKREI
jgi:hypothetical protein